MRTKNYKTLKRLGLVLLLTFAFFNVNSQEKSKKELRKELKEKQKLENIKTTETLIDSKSFVFNADMVYPLGMRSINLTSNNYEVKFQPEMIESYLPYFGRSFNASSYGSNDGGIKFKEKPEKYDVVKGKKNYEIKVHVKDSKDYYQFMLSVSFEGSATLSVSSNNRSQISYRGKISKIEEVKK